MLEIKTSSITDEYDVDWNQKLGTGISGPVRVATKRNTGEKFAIKVVVDRPKAQQEVQMHWNCSGHPHVVTLYEVFRNDLQFPGESESQSRLLLVLELMDGGELFFRISKQHGFTERHAAGTTMQIAMAVQHLHGKNIAHRDLKPENLLYKSSSENSPIKLCDFGFAKLDKGDLMTPQFTPYYVSPQVLEAQRRHRRERTSMNTNVPYTYDKSCDMWSLGVIIYILMCGYPPFYSEHPSSRRAIDRSMRRKIMNGTYNFPEREWARVSDRAKDVVRRLLCVDPHERMSIEELVQHSWLTEEAPDTLLQSPMYMANKTNLEEVAALHESHLRTMRIMERPIDLKPFESVVNPILVRRQQLTRQGENNSVFCPPPVEDPPSVESLRDVIAACLFPVEDHAKSKLTLENSVKVALSKNADNPSLKELVKKFSWNGDQFEMEVDFNQMSQEIKEILLIINNSRI
uniref:MAP kinase-activated protein kinase 5-like n=1 Tax=Phallusia mammillata TaxID=59560 RepID=A0A6F9DKB9_9ASCI|nr:MAP kinase-activated protein kinase 5-like [Phallusia mammillata]